jgi:hypothetical protein
MLNRVLGAAIIGALLGSAGMPAVAYQRPQITADAGKKRRQALFNGAFYQERLIGTKGAGITMAQQKRTARKVRNQQRHKAAARR